MRNGFSLITAAVIVVGFALRSVRAIAPQFENATLEVDGKVVKSSVMREGGETEHVVNGRHFVVHEDHVFEIDAATGNRAWDLKSPLEFLNLRWVGTDGHAIILQPMQIPDNNLSLDPGLQLLRLDVEKKQWLEAVPLPKEKGDAAAREEIIAAESGEHGLIILTQREVEDAKSNAKVTGQRLTLVRDGKQIWTQSFPAPEGNEDNGPWLMAARMPDSVESSIRYLTWVGDKILFCGGETADIRYLDSQGKTIWEIPRVWEFDRGFTGPSVWSHFISRFGDDEEWFDRADDEPGDSATESKMTADEKASRDAMRARKAKLGADYRKRIQGAIIAGPICVVPSRKGLDPSIFVAVAKGAPGWKWRYLAETTVYQISMRGKVIAMAKVPRNIVNSPGAATPSGPVWSCQKGGMVRIGIYDRESGRMGMDEDFVCPMDWYREMRPAVPGDAFLGAGAACDVTTFTESFAYRTIAGGYILANDRHVYRFPITIVDLKTGADKTAILSVPFTGDIGEPTMNYSSIGGKRFVVQGPFKLGVTRLQAQGSSLSITIATDSDAKTLHFAVGR